jgi:hypothetical protein
MDRMEEVNINGIVLDCIGEIRDDDAESPSGRPTASFAKAYRSTICRVMERAITPNCLAGLRAWRVESEVRIAL